MIRRLNDSLTDLSLILRVGRSPADQVAWAEFVDRYGPKVFPEVPYPEPIKVEPPAPDDLRVGAELETAFPEGPRVR